MPHSELQVIAERVEALGYHGIRVWIDPMERKKILISPLNWGFGHAGRMLTLAQALKGRGQEVIFRC